ncbi:MAG: hypothetical protein NZ929_04855 [Aigarchaeota archaeon]|nr:hypothetical protein [Aigarchaeota archaeon]MCX8192891.1 hypothetical protein [Nitrososphaeria archaeon]MDW7986464.1 hypothetical protein [Nitrososphaerota archaeon]
MALTNYIELGIIFTLNWLLFVTGGIVALLILIYLLRRSTSPKPVEIKEKTELKEEKTVEEELELIAGISAVVASLSQPMKTVYVKESLEPSMSPWKISSILHSSRYGGVD